MSIIYRLLTALSVILLCVGSLKAGDADIPSAAAVSRSSWTRTGSLDIGINYPGASVRYFVSDGRALELLGQSKDKVFVGGLRYYRYPSRLSGGSFSPYLAAELDYIKFEGRYSRGGGWGGGAYAGVEWRLSDRVSAQTDLGAMYVSIKDKDTSLMESGLEFVINMAFNFRIGGGWL